MRFTEIANPEDQLALWRLISDNVWSSVLAQARQAAAQKAQAAAKPKPKKFKPKKALPKTPPPPKPKAPSPSQRAALMRLKCRKRGLLARNMAVFKSHGHGDDRHSKNGYATFFLALILLGAKKGVATAPKSSNM